MNDSDGRRTTPDAHAIKAQAFGLGFDQVGIAKLGPADTATAFTDWLANGYGGTMRYLHRSAKKRVDSSLADRHTASAIVVALDYGGRQPLGRVARYARGRDYHAVLHERLESLAQWISATTGTHVHARPYVDTGPILERDLARRAGLGWFGKNSCLIHPERGSFMVLGTLLVALDLAADTPFATEHCGTCTRCLDACPTHAFSAPYVLDATQCISYLTIEYRGTIPEPLRPLIGEWLYGCDICQDVCPWNQKFARDLPAPFLGTLGHIENADPRAWLAFDDDAEVAEQFAGTALARASRRTAVRNAAVVLGNRNAPGDRAVLEAALAREDDAVVREHLSWAVRRTAPGVSG